MGQAKIRKLKGEYPVIDGQLKIEKLNTTSDKMLLTQCQKSQHREKTVFYCTSIERIFKLIDEKGVNKRLIIAKEFDRDAPFLIVEHTHLVDWQWVATVYPNLKLFYENIYCEGFKIDVPEFHDVNNEFTYDDEFETPEDAIDGGEPELGEMLKKHLGKSGDESIVGFMDFDCRLEIYFPKNIALEIDRFMWGLYAMMFNNHKIYVLNYTDSWEQQLASLMSACGDVIIDAQNIKIFYDLYDDFYDDIE